MDILHSRKWNDLLKRIANGKKVLKPRVEAIQIVYVPEIFGTTPLATAMRDGIVVNEATYLALGNRLRKRLLMHEMLHLYMIRHHMLGWNDGNDEFQTYAHYLGCDVEIWFSVKWRTLGEKNWRTD
jgi:hypothetical protein